MDCDSENKYLHGNSVNSEDLKPDVKRRGRKRKEEVICSSDVANSSENIKMTLLTDIQDNNSIQTPEKIGDVKKRGRKPKGGKLTVKPPEKENFSNTISNVILHLKCSLNDLNEHNSKINKIVTDPLEYNPDIPLNILTYNQTVNDTGFSLFDNSSISEENTTSIRDWSSNWTEPQKFFQNGIAYPNSSFTMQDNKNNFNTDNKNTYVYNPEIITHNKSIELLNNPTINSLHKIEDSCNNEKQNSNCIEISPFFENANCSDENINLKEINNKLKKIKINLYKNQNINKKSACFWCTCDFDNPTCYIPKYEMDDKIYGYGSFCRPECAVAYLMKEHIDDSTKFERYHLLNHIYSKVYGFKKNIKPAPCPYFLLDKFYGNLSIQEYRKLLKTEHMLLVIDKPMTRILPELHEENEDLISNIYGSNKPITQNHASNNTGVYKVQRQSEKQQGPSKSSILRDKFGL